MPSWLKKEGMQVGSSSAELRTLLAQRQAVHGATHQSKLAQRRVMSLCGSDPKQHQGFLLAPILISCDLWTNELGL